MLDIVPDEILSKEIKNDFVNRKYDHIKRSVKVKVHDKEINDLTDQKVFMMLEKEKEEAEKERKRREDEQKAIESQKKVKQEINKMGFKLNFKLNIIKNIKAAQEGQPGAPVPIKISRMQTKPSKVLEEALLEKMKFNIQRMNK